jgi:hypothetical protein
MTFRMSPRIQVSTRNQIQLKGLNMITYQCFMILSVTILMFPMPGCESRHHSETIMYPGYYPLVPAACMQGRGNIYPNVPVTGQLTFDDKNEVIERVRAVAEDPILDIETLPNGDIQVTCGVVRGPLDGGGSIYLVRKIGLHWLVVNDDTMRSWVS